jgi:hypothetical protein
MSLLWPRLWLLLEASGPYSQFLDIIEILETYSPFRRLACSTHRYNWRRGSTYCAYVDYEYPFVEIQEFGNG